MPNTPVFAVVVLALAGAGQSGCTGCRVAPSPTLSQRLAEYLRKTQTLKSAPPVAALTCPTFGSLIVPATLQTQGGHRVILSWRASPPADSKHAAAVGYCIYRSEKHKDTSPELVNSMPFPGTSCADDAVENGQKYYYVVRSISANRVTSIISNEAPATIPKQNNSSVSRTSPPLCREPAGAK
ncbi:MAG: hypothetical protein WA252_05220 [Candidatus Sulfotelmatobacter sp.]